MHARLSYLHISPRKVRLAAHILKDMDVRRAELELRHLSKRAALPLEKLLKSAVRNAVHNLQEDASRLYVKQITVNAGPIAKRMRPRAFGRGAPIRKRTSHVSLELGIRGEEGIINKKRKKTIVPVREASWEEMKGGGYEPRASERSAVATLPQKKSGGSVKNFFRRKVI